MNVRLSSEIYGICSFLLPVLNLLCTFVAMAVEFSVHGEYALWNTDE